MASITEYPIFSLLTEIDDCVMQGLTSGKSYAVTVDLSGTTIMSETLTADSDGEITLKDIPGLIEEYVSEQEKSELTISCVVSTSETIQTSTKVYYGNAEVNDFATFAAKYFLASYTSKRTSSDRKEMLTCLEVEAGSEITGNTGTVRAYYTDGTYKDFDITGTKKDAASWENSSWEEGAAWHWLNVYELDVSPSQYEESGKTLYRYVVMVDERTMEYVLDPEHEGCESVFLYRNCFGMWDMLYCNGKIETADSFEREGTYIEGIYRVYKRTETKNFNVDTGVLMKGEIDMAMDILRSIKVYICKFVNGEYSSWFEVVITDNDTTYTDEAESLPRFTMTCRRASKRQNVIDYHIFPEIFSESYTQTYE